MTAELNHFGLWSGLLGGLALFLFGMDLLTRALKVVAGDGMKGILAKLTSNRFMGALTGAVVTGVINSSSVTTVIMVGFISAGLMSMSQAVSVIMGANIGSTMTAQILAFKVTKIALPMITVGFGIWFLTKQEKIKQYGAMIMGLGLVFYGMGVMSDAMRPLRSYQPFLDLMVTMDNRILGILVGAAFTAVIQSSAATTGIVIVMAGQGLIGLPAAIAIAFGANIGTCATAGLACIGKPREAVRAAVVHVLFNVSGVLIWVLFIPELASFVTSISPSAEHLSGAERAAAEAPRQIANAHTIFNVANTFIFIGFTAQITRLVEWMIPDKPIEEEAVIEPRYLDEELISTPSLALERARMEIARLGEHVNYMFADILPAVLSGSGKDLEAVASMDDDVDILHEHIIEYLRRVGLEGLTDEQTKEFLNLMEIANNFENIGDIMETDLVSVGTQRIAEKVTVSEDTTAVMTKLHRTIGESLSDIILAVSGPDVSAAQRAMTQKDVIGVITTKAAAHCAERLVSGDENRLKTYNCETEIIENLKRIYYFAKRIAKTVAFSPAFGAGGEEGGDEEPDREAAA